MMTKTTRRTTVAVGGAASGKAAAADLFTAIARSKAAKAAGGVAVINPTEWSVAIQVRTLDENGRSYMARAFRAAALVCEAMDRIQARVAVSCSGIDGRVTVEFMGDETPAFRRSIEHALDEIAEVV